MQMKSLIRNSQIYFLSFSTYVKTINKKIYECFIINKQPVFSHNIHDNIQQIQIGTNSV